jgi:hemoglobin-like flavoprotein
MNIPLEIKVAHFTPPFFPLAPTITAESSALCTQSWQHIVTNNFTDGYESKLSGITIFYSEFYTRLREVDSSGKFEAVLGSHSSAENRMAAKGAILLRIVSYVLAITVNNRELQMKLYMLGKSHARKNIRPWQYAVFIEMLLLTISSRLGKHATTEVMNAWVNLFALVMKSMLPVAIADQVVETEINVNTSSEFDNPHLIAEVKDLVEDPNKLMMGKAILNSASGTSYSNRGPVMAKKVAVTASSG